MASVSEPHIRVDAAQPERLSHRGQSPEYGQVVSILMVRESGLVQHVNLDDPQPEVIWLLADLLVSVRRTRMSIRTNARFRPSLLMQNLLQALAASESHLTADETAKAAGYPPGTSKVRMALSALRKAGLVTNVSGCGYMITKAGLALLADLEPPKARQADDRPRHQSPREEGR